MNAENYQKQRLDLAAQYSPAQETLRKSRKPAGTWLSFSKPAFLMKKSTRPHE